MGKDGREGEVMGVARGGGGGGRREKGEGRREMRFLLRDDDQDGDGVVLEPDGRVDRGTE